jgi:hypothetical protein
MNPASWATARLLIIIFPFRSVAWDQSRPLRAETITASR